MFDHRLELKKTAKAHQKIKTIVRFEKAVFRMIILSSQGEHLAGNVERRQNNVDADHHEEVDEWRDFLVNPWTFLPWHKNHNKHQNSVNIV
jgi:hypothetical protein